MPRKSLKFLNLPSGQIVERLEQEPKKGSYMPKTVWNEYARVRGVLKNLKERIPEQMWNGLILSESERSLEAN